MINEHFETLAQEKENDFKAIQEAVKHYFHCGQVTEESLMSALKISFDLGHYAGHCRAEGYAHKLNQIARL